MHKMGKTSDLLDRIMTHGPSQSTILLILAEMTEKGRYNEVIQGCLKALNIYPDDIRLRNLLGESYLKAGFVGLAEAELSRVTPEIEKLSFAYKLLARIYEKQKRFEEALESLKKYQALNPDDPEAILLFDKISQTESSAEPEEAPALNTLQSLPKKEVITEVETEKTVECEKVASATEEELADLATPTLAELYFDQKQIHEAIKIYEKVLLNNPDDKNSEQRLNELKTSLNDEFKPQSPKRDDFREKTERSIEILEDWLARIRENNYR